MLAIYFAGTTNKFNNIFTRRDRKFGGISIIMKQICALWNWFTNSEPPLSGLTASIMTPFSMRRTATAKDHLCIMTETIEKNYLAATSVFVSSLHGYIQKTKQAQTPPTVCLQCADRGGIMCTTCSVYLNQNLRSPNPENPSDNRVSIYESCTTARPGSFGERCVTSSGHCWPNSERLREQGGGSRSG